MKKLFILFAVFILAAGFVFAQEFDGDDEESEAREIELINIELSLGFPVHWTNGVHDDSFYQIINEATGANMMEDKSVTANTAFGIGLNLNLTKTLGVTLEMDIFYGAKLAGFASPTSDYNSLFGLNLFLGPVFYLFNNNVLRVPLAVGAHMYFFSDDLWVPEISTTSAWMNRKDLQIGPALHLGVQFHFDNGIYLFCRTQVSIDMVRIHKIDWLNVTTDEYESNSCTDIMDINWAVKPVFGLGIKY